MIPTLLIGLASLAVGRVLAADGEIPASAARDLLGRGGFEPSTGIMPGKHWRKPDGQGEYHLRVSDGRWYIHRDTYAAGKSPVKHFFVDVILR